MLLFERLLRRLGFIRSGETLRFALEEPFDRLLVALAEQEQRPVEEVAAALLMDALSERQQVDDNLAHWQLLSPREQQVAALVCLNCTNPQIAARLNLSPQTVKTHVQHVLAKFGLRTKPQLRQLLSGWDFSAWE